MKRAKIIKRHHAVATGQVHPQWFEEGTIVTDPQVVASALATGNGREVTAEAEKKAPESKAKGPAPENK